MANMTFDPQGSLGGAAQGAIGVPVIIGLPSVVAPIPNFVMGVTTHERVNTRTNITGLPITDGDLVMKSARGVGRYTFDFALSATPNVSSQQVRQITQMLQQISNVASSLLGAGGGLAALTGVSSNPISTQIRSLENMKDGFQPIFALNLFMPLSSFSIVSSYLTSGWYIETLDYDKEEAAQGGPIKVTLKELLSKKASGVAGIIENIANQVLGAAVGSSVGGLL